MNRSRVLELAEIDEATLASYEEAGLVIPGMEGDEPVYTGEDVEVIRMIRRLMDDLGVSLPGVEVILNMREQMIAMQKEFDRVINDIRQGVIKEFSAYEERFRRPVPPLIEDRRSRPSRVRIKE